MSTDQTPSTSTSASAPATGKPTPGSANSSSWNDSAFAFAPNTNVLDRESMPSDAAAQAREKTARIMAAMKSGDTATANALLGKDETKGRLLPGVGWMKKKLNARGGQQQQQQQQAGGQGRGKGKVLADSESDVSKV